jgi:GNAT superfamily N-acetyltransferase
VKAPQPLSASHHIDGFDCGNDTMNSWLKQRALGNQDEGATRTFVVCDDHDHVLGYYALAVGACDRADAPGNLSRGMPDPIPMMILARLAVDKTIQGKGLARHMIADAVLRTLKVAEQAGVRGLMVSAIDAAAAAYYEKLGFIRAKNSPDILMLRLKVAKDILAASK